MELEDFERYQLDWGSTMIANVVGIIFALIVFIYIIFTISFIIGIEDSNTQLIALIVYMFSVFKILTMIGSPTLQYKLRDSYIIGRNKK